MMTFELSGVKTFELSSMTKMTKNKLLKPGRRKSFQMQQWPSGRSKFGIFVEES